MDNLKVYNIVRKPPEEAIKTIGGGRLKGMSDINPMWRIKTLTEQFGLCGVGWKYDIIKQWLEPGAGGEIAAFMNIHLFIKVDGQWSDAIPGTGGSSFVANERNGLYTSDECFKMALTDAISVSCKALGFGADVYWAKDRTKYDQQTEKVADTPEEAAAVKKVQESPINEISLNVIKKLIEDTKTDTVKMLEYLQIDSLEKITNARFPEVLKTLNAKKK